MPKSISENSSYKIQVLRGLAIVAVVLIHNTPKGIAQVWCRPFINFSVGLFLFLSGLLSNVDNWNPKRRITKVIVPYIIWTAVYVAIYKHRDISNLPVIYIKMLLSANAAAMMYYIFVYCELTILIPVIDKISKSKYKWIAFAISPIEIAVMRLLPLITGYGLNKYVRAIVHVSCLGWFIYFYLGYLIGNGRMEIKLSSRKLLLMWIGAIILQVLEGYWYLSLGEKNCGTQGKLTVILAGTFFMLLAYKYIISEHVATNKLLKLLGDRSFGIYFSHLAVMSVLSKVPYYKTFAIYPINAIITTFVSLICVIIGGKILGKYAKYLAL